MMEGIEDDHALAVAIGWRELHGEDLDRKTRRMLTGT